METNLHLGPMTPMAIPSETTVVRKPRALHARQALLKAARRLGIGLVLLAFLLPLLWMVLNSFKNQIDITNAEDMLRFAPTLENYRNVFEQHDYGRYLWNTFVVATVSTLLSLALGLPAAYAIARFRTTWFGLVLLTARMVPGIIFMVPWYIVFGRLGLVGTFWPLILSHMVVGLPFIAWIMIPFFESLPVELEEAARIDGCSAFGVFFRIALPLAVPGIVTASIMAFIFSWNNFMFSLVLAGDRTRTLPVAIFDFVSYSSVDWGALMAAAVVITLPVLVITMFVQRYIVAGLTAGATKG